MVAYFRLKVASSYDGRSPETGKIYTFTGLTPVGVTEPKDVFRFRNMTDMFVEVDEKGTPIAESQELPPGAAFTSKGMVQPKSYTKVGGSAPLPPPPPPAPSAPRTIVSSKPPAEPSAAEPAKPVEPVKPAEPVIVPPSVKPSEKSAKTSRKIRRSGESGDKSSVAPSDVSSKPGEPSGK